MTEIGRVGGDERWKRLQQRALRNGVRMSRNIRKAFESHGFRSAKECAPVNGCIAAEHPEARCCRDTWTGGDFVYQEIAAAPAESEFSGQQVKVLFADLDKAVLEWIKPFDAVFGCVAWLTHPAILAAVNKKRVAQIVMQKESWLRDDDLLTSKESNPLYQVNANLCDRGSIVGLPGVLNSVEPEACRYRVFGFSTKKRPHMHHKFLVGCAMTESEVQPPRHWNEEWGDPPKRIVRLKPTSVWAGSFNMTLGSHRNLDSAIVMGAEPAEVYLMEWRDVFIHSEPLNFESAPHAPDLELGL